jgi:hypothetical protein
MKLTGHVARMQGMRNADNISVRKRDRERDYLQDLSVNGRIKIYGNLSSRNGIGLG